MPRVKLTDRFVQSAKTTTPSRVDFSDESQRGLVLRVTSSGARTYTVTYFRDGKRQRVTLGPADVLSLKDARQGAADIRARVLRGEDPAAEKRLTRAASALPGDIAAQTVPKTLQGLIDVHASPEGRRAARRALPAGWPEYRRVIEHVFQPVLSEPLADINEDRLQAVLDAHPSKGSAARAWAYLRPAIKSAKKLTGGEWRLADIDDVRAHHLTRVRDRVLSETELRRLLALLRQRVGDPYADGLYMLLLTGCRAEELLGSDRHPSRGMLRHHVEADGAWIIPSTKNGRGFVVPLPCQGLEIIARQAALHTHPRVFTEANGAGAHLRAWVRRIAAFAEQAGIETHFNRHDLRRSFATGAQKIGVPDMIVDACLGHAHGGGARHYLHGRAFWTERADAHRKWADYIDGLR